MSYLSKSIFSFGITLLLIACSTAAPIVPSSLKGKEISLYVARAIDNESNRRRKTLVYKFRDNNSYRVAVASQPLHAGNYSYNVRSKDSARVVLTYSQNNELKSYELILTFETPTAGTWESSYNHDSVGAEGGTFEITKE